MCKLCVNLIQLLNILETELCIDKALNGSTSNWWLGLTDEAEEANYKWIDGKMKASPFLLQLYPSAVSPF